MPTEPWCRDVTQTQQCDTFWFFFNFYCPFIEEEKSSILLCTDFQSFMKYEMEILNFVVKIIILIALFQFKTLSARCLRALL